MESLLEPVELNRETTQTLDEIRSGTEKVGKREGLHPQPLDSWTL
jgi:hypothetical protein